MVNKNPFTTRPAKKQVLYSSYQQKRGRKRKQATFSRILPDKKNLNGYSFSSGKDYILAIRE